MEKNQYIGIALIAFAFIAMGTLVYTTIGIYNGTPAPVSLENQLSPQVKQFVPVIMVNLAFWGILATTLTGILVVPAGYFGIKLFYKS